MRLGAVGGDGGVRALSVSGVPGDPGRDGGRMLSPPSPPRVLLLRATLTAPYPPREPALQPRGGGGVLIPSHPLPSATLGRHLVGVHSSPLLPYWGPSPALTGSVLSLPQGLH